MPYIDNAQKYCISRSDTLTYAQPPFHLTGRITLRCRIADMNRSCYIEDKRIHGNFLQLDWVDWMTLMTLCDTIHFTVLVASYTEKAPPLLFCLNLLWARDCSWMALARAVMVEILIESSRGSFSSPSSVFSFVRPLFISILLLLHFHRPLNILIITSNVPELQ